MPPLVPLKWNKYLHGHVFDQFTVFEDPAILYLNSAVCFCFFIWLENCFCLWKTVHYCYNCPVLIMTLVTLQYAAIMLLSICFLGAGKSTLINILAGYKWAPYLLLLSIYIIKTAVFSVFCCGSLVTADIKRQGSWFFPGYFDAKIEEKKEPKEMPGSFDSLHYILVVPGNLKS